MSFFVFLKSLPIIFLILTILIGAFIGWLAGKFMKSRHGFLMNCLLGIVGSFLGVSIANAFHLPQTMLMTLIYDVAGTCLFIAVVRVILGKKF